MASRVNRKPDRSSKFRYKGRSFKAAKERSEKRGGSWETIFKAGFDTWRPKEGDNQIRILPIPDSEHYAAQVWTHDRIGPDNSQFVCPRKMQSKACPICEKAREAREAGESDEAKALGVKEHFVCWIIDREEDEETPKLYIMSNTQDSNLMSLCLNNRSGAVILIDEPDNGFDVMIKRTGKKLNTKYLFSIDRESSAINDDSKTQNEILDYVSENTVDTLLVIRPGSYLKTAMIGSVEERDEELDEEEDDRPRKRRGEEEEGEDEEIKKGKKSKSKSKKNDDDDDDKEEDNDDDNNEEEEKSPRRKSKKDDDEDEDDDNDPEEEKKSRRKSKSKDDDDDEEDNDDDNNEEEEKSPRRKSKKDDDDDEDEDEEEKPRKRPGRR